MHVGELVGQTADAVGPDQGAIWTVLRIPKAWPALFRKPLPESPGMPGVSV